MLKISIKHFKKNTKVVNFVYFAFCSNWTKYHLTIKLAHPEKLNTISEIAVLRRFLRKPKN